MADDDEAGWIGAGLTGREPGAPSAVSPPPPGTAAPPFEAPPTPPTTWWRRWRKRIALGVAALFVLLLGWLVVTAPLGRALEPLEDPALLILSAEGRPIARRGAMKLAPVEVARLDPLTPAAFIAIEDRRFYRHWGIDPLGIARAMVANARAGAVRQGGSTLTQQLAKTSFLTSDRNLGRKAREMIIALWLEAWLSKDEILSRYLSSVYFGDGVYGLRAAALHYFDREPERLTLAQSAMLAGMMKAPSRLAPTRNLKAAQARSRLVLNAMEETGAIAPGRAAATRSARPVRGRDTLPTGTYFADWVAPQAQREGPADYGERQVTTTLDWDLQRLAARAVSRAAIGDAQAALVAMRPDGAVVAMVGGTSYSKSPFNRATQARRQPGSAFKLFVYLAALRAGWHPNDPLDDGPITIDGWSPVNADGVFRGPITLREAFARSSNAATVRLAEQVGRGNVLRAARELGVTSPMPDTPSVSLGTAGVSLLELTQAYAAVASGRYPVKAHGLPPRAEAEPGLMAALLGRSGRLEPRRDWAPMYDLLWAAANEGTGRRAALAAAPTFGKTGTTQENRDALFVGFAGNLVVGVWVGHDDNRSLGRITGGTAPAQIWRQFMGGALAIDDSRPPPLPPGFVVPRRAGPAAPSLPAPQADPLGEAIEALGQLVDELFAR